MKRVGREFLETILLAGVLVFLLNTFIAQFYLIPSPSMEPTLLVGDRIIALKVSYWGREPERGDLVVFRFPQDAKITLVKRVVGLPGENLSVRDNVVYIDDVALSEPYVSDQKIIPDFDAVQIPPAQYFMLGDNRDNSADSRVWGFVAAKAIKGKAVFRYWPLGRMGRISS